MLILVGLLVRIKEEKWEEVRFILLFIKSGALLVPGNLFILLFFFASLAGGGVEGKVMGLFLR